MTTYNILCLDGGGVRGLLTARLLELLEAKHPFLGKIDLFAGTSTGGIIALGLAGGLTANDLVNMYQQNAGKIFEDNFFDDLVDLVKLAGADYDNDNLKHVLAETFQAKKLMDLEKKVLVSTFDLDTEQATPRDAGAYVEPRTWKPKFIHNFLSDAGGPNKDLQTLVVDAALRTSAAPTYFPSYQGYVDGGVVANNPTMCALAQALDKPTEQRLDNLRVLSVGTGWFARYISGQNLDWGFVRWAPNLIRLMIEGSVGLADYQCKRLLGKHYHRLDPLLNKPIELDDDKATNKLLQVADAANLTETVTWLQTNIL